MNMLILEKLKNSVNLKPKAVKQINPNLIAFVKWSFMIVLFSHLAATILTSWMLGFFGKMSSSNSMSIPAVANAQAIKIQNTLNLRDMQKSVIERNIFNSEGKLPDESEATAGGSSAGQFDINAACRKPNLPIELSGIIYAGKGGESLAIIQEKGYSEVDVYRKGDAIIGNEAAVIYAIDQYRVILNNNGVKECLDLSYGSEYIDAVSGNKGGAKAVAAVDASKIGGSEEQCPPSVISLDGPYIEQNLGPGFAIILDQGRLVPHNEDNKMVGFKLIAVKSNSLWRKIGMNTGDIVTNVNDVSMSLPDQGFMIYQALQDDREIRVQFKKNGTTPCSLTIQVK